MPRRAAAAKPKGAPPAAAEPAQRFGPPPAPSIGLDAVAGHAALRRFLAAALAADRLPHALLFFGPRGVGKRTLAQALAAQRLCRQGSGCGACTDCGQLLRGGHPSLVTLAVAAGRNAITIEQVQELSRQLSLVPPDARGRITLLLGAERMTGPAQDALLKTLEEPRPGNVLVLTAGRADAVLPTIRSRCQRFALLPLAEEELAGVARRLGVTGALPLSAAGGCPGVLVEWSTPLVDRLRRAVAKLLAEPRGTEDLGKWIVLLHEELPADAESAEVRARARLLLRLLSSLVRDAVVLRARGSADTIRHVDQLDRLQAIASRPEWADAGEAIGRLARALDRIDGYVDPASALLCALQPAADEAALEGEA